MATTEKPTLTTSWADATEDETENSPPPSKSAGNAWAKGNPWGTVSNPPREENGVKGPRYERDFPDLNERDFPPPGKNYPRKRDEQDRGDERKEERDYPPREEAYRRPPRDYYEHDDRREPRRYDDRPRYDRPRDDRPDFNRRDDRREEDRRDDRFDRERDFDRRDDRRRDDRRPFGGRGGGFRDRPERPAREPVPLPTSPPYTAYVGNLNFDARDEDIRKFFEVDAKVLHVRLQFDKESNRSKGYGYVEFEDLESLENALKHNGEDLFGRPIKIDVAEGRPDDRNRETFGGGRGGRRPFGTGFRDRPERDQRDRPERDAENDEDQDDRKERPKLELKPRSAGPGEAKEPEPSDVYQKKGKSNPFGSARPRDENYYLKKKEEEKKQREQKEKEEVDVKEEVKGENGDRKEEKSPAHSPPPERRDNGRDARRDDDRAPRDDTNRDVRPPPRRDDRFRDREERRPFGRGSPRDRDDRPPRDRDDRAPRDRDDRPPRERDDRPPFKRDERRPPPRDDRPPFKKDDKRDDRRKEEGKTRTSRADSAAKEEERKENVANDNRFALLQSEDDY